MDLNELRRKRAALIKQARDLLDKAEQEKRALTAEEEQQWDRLMAEADEIRKTIEREERLQTLERDLAASQGTVAGRRDPPGGTADPAGGGDEVRAAFRKFLRGGHAVLTETEVRALEAGRDDLGGYIVAPQQFVTQFIKAVDDLVFIRRLATKFTLERSESLGVPALDSDVSDADWTTELATGTEDTTLKFGKRELRPHPLAKRVKVSNKLLRQAVIDPEALVRDRLAYKFGITEEKAFLTGDGVGKPLGLFVASAMGISTGRDVSNGNTATAITFDGLISAKYALKSQYWPRAQWLFHRNAVEQIAKIKDLEGQYVWRESTRAGEPDRLLGFPVNMSEYVPNTFTAGQYVGMLADFSWYWIVDALDMQIQRLVELYAETNQVGFIARRELDGMPVLEEAFVRVKLAAA